MYEKIIIVTRSTRLQGLIERFNTKQQARFYIEHAGGDFSDYVAEDEAYRKSLFELERTLDASLGLKVQSIDRSFVPTFLFSQRDLIIAVGQDGLVANTAKYVGCQPIIGINPEPSRFDGILVPFIASQAHEVVLQALQGKAQLSKVTLAEATLNDGQTLLAFNDLFVGVRSHVSAHYRIQFQEGSESHSSSGLIVSTGAGSTGWLSSTFNMAAGLAEFTGGHSGAVVHLKWEDPRLVFVVREPFISKHSSAAIVAGIIDPGQELVVESLTPANGAIFSDGIETDYLAFNSGTIARIKAADKKASIIVP